MQVKKDEMKTALIISGEKEFLEKGYEKASIRHIVKQAGTTIGNFYNYFDNKEALFNDVVKDDLNKFMIFIKGHNDETLSDIIWSIKDPQELRVLLTNSVVGALPQFGKGLVILLDCSEGTEYADSRKKLIQFVEEHFKEHLEAYETSRSGIKYAGILANQFIHGMIVIFRDHEDVVTRNELLIEHLLFYMFGSMSLIVQNN